MHYTGTKIRYTCNQCDQDFKHEFSLKNHFIEVHENPFKQFQCDRCDKKYGRKGDLVKHIKDFHENIRFPCNICQKTFSKKNLPIHIRGVHKIGIGNTKYYNCNHCDRVYNSNSGLNRHKYVVHDGIRYSCRECDKKFTTKGKMKIHLNNVHGKLDLQYSCDLCKKDFKVKKYMLDHTRRHNLKKTDKN